MHESVDPSIIGPRVVNAIRAGGGQEFLPFAGQSAALIHDVVPVAELMRRLVEETRIALHKANSAVIQS